MNLIEKVRETIKRYSMFTWGDRVVMGVSGGPDSVCLLYLLNSLKDEFNLSLHIAHLDHMLRKDSKYDILFVKEMAEKLNLPITTEKINIPKLAKKGSIEEIARKVRFDFLFRVAKDIGAKKIVLGHNKDDQAETILLRILRGAGLYGLMGILPKREISGYTVVRPLIEAERKEIERYLKRRKIKTILDRSNNSVIYLRNRIRNRLIPLLETQYNRNIRKILCHTAEIVETDYNYLEKKGREELKDLRVKSNLSKIKLNLSKLLRLHPAIQRIVLRLAISDLKGDTRRLTFKHLKELEDLIKTRPKGSIVDLPKNISVQKEAKYLSIYFR